MGKAYLYANIVVVLVTLWGVTAYAQSGDPKIVFIGAEDGVVEPGESLSIRVYPGAVNDIEGVVVMGSLGEALLAYAANNEDMFMTNQAPYELQWAIPSDFQPGKYSVAGLIKRKSGEIAPVRPSEITVGSGSSKEIVALEEELTLVDTWRYRGQTMTVPPAGVTASGAKVYIDEWIKCTSNRPEVMAVLVGCKVAVVGEGDAVIHASYKDIGLDMPVKVGALKRGDYDGDGRVDTADVTYLREQRNSPVTPTGDDRDLNGDGKIDALDLRVLTTLCTRPRCATN